MKFPHPVFRNLASFVVLSLGQSGASGLLVPADVVLSLLHPVHRVDPAAAWAHLCLRQLRRMCLRRPDLVMLIRSLWESPCTKSKFGPITSAKRALDFWVGPGLSLKFLFLQIDPLSDGCSILVLSFSIRFVKHFERRV